MTTEQIPVKNGLSASTLKLLAVLAMFTDHTAYALLDFYTVPAQIMHIIGRLTIPIMCFFVGEGLRHTRSIRNYVLRMGAFWIISAIPFYMFFGDMYGIRQNIMLDLLIGLVTTATLADKQKKTPVKIAVTFVLMGISLGIGGWPVLPTLYILIFYFGRDMKQRIKWFVITTFVFVTGFIGLVLLNNIFHFSSYEWIWWDRVYLYGFLLAAPLLLLYNGKRGLENSPFLREATKWGFYIVYPLHLLILALLFKEPVLSAYEIYVALNALALVLVLAMVEVIRFSRKSSPQSAILVLMVCASAFAAAFLAEITAGDVNGAITATKLEYVAECGIFLSLTSFVKEFCKVRIPRIIQILQYAAAGIIMFCVFTIGHNDLFYTSYEMDCSGEFPKIALEYGTLFPIAQGAIAGTFFMVAVVCGYKMTKTSGTERKRNLCILLGCVSLWVEICLYFFGFTGGYDLICLGILSVLAFFTFALLHYGFFDSIQAANENAINHSKEGILVIGSNNRILFFNPIISKLFPELRTDDDISSDTRFTDVLDNKTTTITINDRTYEMRAEPLVENGFVQGQMLWVLDMTDYFENLRLIRNRAETDPLTGLYNRACFEQRLTQQLVEKRCGTMIMLDMDNFKYVNDTYGHGVGDKVLILFANILLELINDKGMMCRIGGDEFCGFIADITEITELSAFAESVIERFAEGLHQAQLPEMTTVSIGFAVYDGTEDTSFISIYGNADKALYISKNSGKNTYSFYSGLTDKDCRVCGNNTAMNELGE